MQSFTMALEGWINAHLVQIISGVIILLISRLTLIIVSRLVLSPIAKFPGPKLAALSYWYEFYYEVVKGGKYTWKIRELHDKYG